MNRTLGLFSLLLICTSGAAYAQEYPDDDAFDAWHVELLVFRHRHATGIADDLYTMQAAQLLPLAASGHFPGTPRATTDLRVVLRYEERALNEQAGRIKASRDLELLHHVAWIQPDQSAGRAAAVNLLPEQVNGLVAGIARVSNGRHHQLELQLRYDLDVEPRSRKTDHDEAASRRDQADPSFVHEPGPPSSRILHIRMAAALPGNTATYLDHAVLGALVIVKKADARPQPGLPPPTLP